MRKNVLAIAMAAYAVIGAYSATIGDTPMPPWDKADQKVRDGTVKGVEYALENPTLTPEDQHNAWAAERMADGWVHGKVKDPEAKTDPSLVPYHQLPADQRVKDVLFRTVVFELDKILPDESDVPAHPALAVGTQSLTPTSTEGFKAIKYFHPTRPDFEDFIHGTRLKFKENQVRSLPIEVADKLLTHVDMFTEVGTEYAPPPEVPQAVTLEEQKREQLDQRQVEIQATRDLINTLPNKQALVDFAKAKYQQDIDIKAFKREELQQKVLGLVDLYGPAA